MDLKEIETPKCVFINNKIYPAKIITGFKREKRIIKKFRLQLLVRMDDGWREIRRCDTAHGKIHLHIFHKNRQSDVIEIKNGDIKKHMGEQVDKFEENTEKWIISYLLNK